MADETYTDEEEEVSASSGAEGLDTDTDANFGDLGEETEGDVEDDSDDDDDSVGEDLNNSDDGSDDDDSSEDTDDSSSDDSGNDDSSDGSTSDDANQGEETDGDVEEDTDDDDVGTDLNDTDDDNDTDGDDSSSSTDTDLTIEDLSEWVSPTDALCSRILAAYNACRSLRPTAEAVELITKAVTYDRQLRLIYRRGRRDGRNEVYEEYRQRRNVPIDDDNGIGGTDIRHNKQE